MGCLCTGCTAAVFSKLEKSVCEREIVKDREVEKKSIGEGKMRVRRKSKSTFLLPFRQTRCL